MKYENFVNSEACVRDDAAFYHNIPRPQSLYNNDFYITLYMQM